MSRGENEKKEDFFRSVGIGENRNSLFSGSDAFLCRTGNADCQVFQTAADHALRHNRADRLEYGVEHIPIFCGVKHFSFPSARTRTPVIENACGSAAAFCRSYGGKRR